MSDLHVFVEGVGLYAPGLNGWQQSRPILAEPAHYVCTPIAIAPIDSLPAAERRRLGTTVKLAMACCYDAAQHLTADALAQLPSVFASSAGDSENCHHLLDALAAPEPSLSPTRFHNAVHNAAAGYWSIATACRQPSISLGAFDAGFAAALLEAASQVACSGQPNLLVVYDIPYPEPLHALRKLACAFGVALLLSPRRSANSLASLTLALTPDAADTLPTPELESMRQQVPAARALPLLCALAQARTQRLVLDYLAGPNLAIELAP